MDARCFRSLMLGLGLATFCSWILGAFVFAMRPSGQEDLKDSNGSDPCPRLVAAASTSEEYLGWLVPYRLVKGDHGLGVFALRKVRRGEPVYSENDDSKAHLTEAGWREQLGELVLLKIWKADPEIDEAYGRLVTEDMTAGTIPEEMLRYILKRHWMCAYKRGDVFIELNDGRFTNYAPLRREGDEEEEKEQEDEEWHDSYQRVQGDPVMLMVAHRDIEPCTEILEDYDDDRGPYARQPEWFLALRRRIGSTSGFEVDSTTTLANIRQVGDVTSAKMRARR